MENFLIVGNVSDDPFSLDIGHLCGQPQDVSDIISLKTFANSEFCPRFIVQDEEDLKGIGTALKNKDVIIQKLLISHNIFRFNKIINILRNFNLSVNFN